MANTITYPNSGAVVTASENLVIPTVSGNGGKVLAVNSGATALEFVGNTGGWTTLAVSGSNFTTTSNTLVNITGLSFSATASTLYEIECTLRVGSSSAAGIQIGLNSTGGSPTVAFSTIGNGSTGANMVTSGQQANNTAQGTAMATNSQIILQKVWALVNSGTGSPTISLRILKTTSGTATVYIGSVMRYRVFGT